MNKDAEETKKIRPTEDLHLEAALNPEDQLNMALPA
jgi:hypothetical protein